LFGLSIARLKQLWSSHQAHLAESVVSDRKSRADAGRL
jgi:hypothetical protein